MTIIAVGQKGESMSDLIDRQAAIDTTWEEPTYSDPLNVLTEVRDRLKGLPSAQPDVPDINDGDIISRRAAIDVTANATFSVIIGGKRGFQNYKEEFEKACVAIRDKYIEALKALPAVQPEIIRCRDCKHKPSGSGVNHDISFPDEVCPCQCEDYWYSWMPDDNWFCGNGERKES